MSKIIKGSELLLFQPKVIDLTAIYELKRQIEAENLALIELEEMEEIKDEKQIMEAEINLKKEELERLKAESQKILNDTENMLKDLLQKVREESRTIINDAQEEAEVIRQQVFAEAELLRENSLKEGYDAGLKRAQQEIEADRQLAMQQSQAILEEARQTKLEIMRSSEPDMVRLAMAVAKKVIGGELVTNPNTIANILREALSFLDSPENVTVYVNAKDVEKVFEVMENEIFNDMSNSEVQINVYANNGITPGGCKLESDAGAVDAQVETRISSAEKAIQEVTADE